MNAPISLYALAAEYREAADRLADLDLPEEVVRDTLEGMSGALEVKATNVAFFVRNLEATAAQIKEAETQLYMRRKQIETRAERVKAYLLANLEATGISKIDSPYFKIAVRENPPSVVIDAESQIPAKFMRRAEPPPPAPDKKAIADAIKRGEEVPGCHLTRTTKVDIK